MMLYDVMLVHGRLEMTASTPLLMTHNSGNGDCGWNVSFVATNTWHSHPIARVVNNEVLPVSLVNLMCAVLLYFISLILFLILLLGVQ